METINGARVSNSPHSPMHESGGSDEIDIAGLSGALTEPEIGAFFPGLVIRPRFALKSNTEIYISAGIYHHAGTVEQLVFWDSQLTTQGGSLTVDNWNYLYLDDSAIVTLGSNLLTASELIWSITLPSWSESKHGWYNSNDRCMFAIWHYGASITKLFYHDGGEYIDYDGYSFNLAAAAISDTWTDVTLTMPNFGDNQHAFVQFRPAYVNSPEYYQYRKNGSSAINVINYCGPTATTGFDSRRVTVDSAQKIEVRFGTSSGNQASVDMLGWFLPGGM